MKAFSKELLTEMVLSMLNENGLFGVTHTDGMPIVFDIPASSKDPRRPNPVVIHSAFNLKNGGWLWSMYWSVNDNTETFPLPYLVGAGVIAGKARSILEEAWVMANRSRQAVRLVDSDGSVCWTSSFIKVANLLPDEFSLIQWLGDRDLQDGKEYPLAQFTATYFAKATKVK